MKDKILSELKTEYKSFGLSEENFDGLATFVSCLVTSEDGISKAVKDAKPLVVRMQSDADRARREKSDLEKKIADLSKPKDEADNNGADGKDKEKDKDSDVPSWAKGIMETMTTLANDVKNIKGDKLSSERTSEINSLIKDLPKSVQKTYERINLATYSAEDYEKLKEEVKAEAENIAKEISSKPFNPPFGGQHNNTGSQSKPSEEQIKKVVGMMNL